jgi:hypothetical protein
MGQGGQTTLDKGYRRSSERVRGKERGAPFSDGDGASEPLNVVVAGVAFQVSRRISGDARIVKLPTWPTT